MREIKKRTVRAAVCATLLSGWAATAAADDINVSFSGYGTLGGTFTSDSKYSYYHDATEFTGASNQFDVGLESRLGLQAVVDFGSGFSVTAQELAKQRGSDQFSLGTEWLYMQYAPDSDWKIRLGRVVQPTFLLSDSRNVGYAAPWFRAPNEVYGAEPFQHMDGGQAQWHHNFGAVGVGLVVGYGNTEQQFQAQGTVTDVKVRDTYHTVVTLDYSNLTFRVARTIEDIPEAFPATFTLKDQFLSTGLQYDDGKAIVMTEWSKRTENDVPGVFKPTTSSTQWYAAGGWRFGKLTPLVKYGNFKQQQSLFFQEGSWGSWSGSLRYDVAHNVALKAQVSRAPVGSSAVDGKDGLVKLKSDPGIKLVVADVNMPNMDGLTMVEKIRGELGNAKVNLIMLTTESSPNMKERGKAAGVKGWIVKPFKGTAVLETFKKLVA